MQKGVSVIELLVAIAIIAIGFSAVFALVTFSLATTGVAKHTAMANELAREGMEAAIAYRNSTSWNADDSGNEYDGLGVLVVNTDYHVATSSGNVRWQMLSGAGTVGDFMRTVRFQDVYRDGDDNITESGGTLDSETKQVTVTVSWTAKSRAREVKLVTYLTNWR